MSGKPRKAAKAHKRGAPGVSRRPMTPDEIDLAVKLIQEADPDVKFGQRELGEALKKALNQKHPFARQTLSKPEIRKAFKARKTGEGDFTGVPIRLRAAHERIAHLLRRIEELENENHRLKQEFVEWSYHTKIGLPITKLAGDLDPIDRRGTGE